jgi:hypothetical protein
VLTCVGVREGDRDRDAIGFVDNDLTRHEGKLHMM